MVNNVEEGIGEESRKRRPPTDMDILLETLERNGVDFEELSVITNLRAQAKKLELEASVEPDPAVKAAKTAQVASLTQQADALGLIFFNKVLAVYANPDLYKSPQLESILNADLQRAQDVIDGKAQTYTGNMKGKTGEDAYNRLLDQQEIVERLQAHLTYLVNEPDVRNLQQDQIWKMLSTTLGTPDLTKNKLNDLLQANKNRLIEMKANEEKFYQLNDLFFKSDALKPNRMRIFAGMRRQAEAFKQYSGEDMTSELWSSMHDAGLDNKDIMSVLSAASLQGTHIHNIDQALGQKHKGDDKYHPPGDIVDLLKRVEASVKDADKNRTKWFARVKPDKQEAMNEAQKNLDHSINHISTLQLQKIKLREKIENKMRQIAEAKGKISKAQDKKIKHAAKLLADKTFAASVDSRTLEKINGFPNKQKEFDKQKIGPIAYRAKRANNALWNSLGATYKRVDILFSVFNEENSEQYRKQMESFARAVSPVDLTQLVSTEDPNVALNAQQVEKSSEQVDILKQLLNNAEKQGEASITDASAPHHYHGDQAVYDAMHERTA